MVPPQVTTSTATEHAVLAATGLAPELTLSSEHRASTATEHAVDAATELAPELTLSSTFVHFSRGGGDKVNRFDIIVA